VLLTAFGDLDLVISQYSFIICPMH